MANSSTCSRCNSHEESFLHCVRDCRFSRIIWHKIGFSDSDFFTISNPYDWIQNGVKSTRSPLFLAGLWWVWRYRNLMCINNETWSLYRLSNNIQSTAESLVSCFHLDTPVRRADRAIKWNSNNHTGTILNVDGSYIAGRAGFGGILRNNAGHFILGFSGYIPNTDDILLAELLAIHHGLQAAIGKGLTNLVCYSDSQTSIDLILRATPEFHIYAALIQDIKDLLARHNFTLLHTLREGNHCADLLAKKGATSVEALVTLVSPPDDLLDQLRFDAMGVYFPRP